MLNDKKIRVEEQPHNAEGVDTPLLKTRILLPSCTIGTIANGTPEVHSNNTTMPNLTPYPRNVLFEVYS